MPNTLLLVDAYAMIYRAFYAIRGLTGPAGQPVNAVFGFIKMTRKLLNHFSPTHAAVVYDLGPPAKRLALLPQYKAQRPPTPPDLETQLPAIRRAVQALGLMVVEQEGEEADDLVATLAVTGACQDFRVYIVSHDKDFFQLVGPRIQVIRSELSGVLTYDEEAVRKRYGIGSDQVVDFLSLVGDTADNIPGVPGVGEKTAALLLQQYGALDRLLEQLDELTKPKLRQSLAEWRDQLVKNRQLIALQRDVPLTVSLDEMRLAAPDYGALIALGRELGFKSLVEEWVRNSIPQDDLFSKR